MTPTPETLRIPKWVQWSVIFCWLLIGVLWDVLGNYERATVAILFAIFFLLWSRESP